MKNKIQKNIKKFLILICICLVLLLVYKIINIYAVFYSEMTGNINFENGKWNIYINETEVSNGYQTVFTIGQIETEESEFVADGKLAPGGSGSFEMLIDPTDTDVAIKYDISLNKENLTNKNLTIKYIEETNTGATLIRTGENTYTGIMSLSDIKNGITHNIKLGIKWVDDGQTDVEDTKLGSIKGNKVGIPITFSVIQYLGETITEYVEILEEE